MAVAAEHFFAGPAPVEPRGITTPIVDSPIDLNASGVAARVRRVVLDALDTAEQAELASRQRAGQLIQDAESRALTIVADAEERLSNLQQQISEADTRLAEIRDSSAHLLDLAEALVGHLRRPSSPPPSLPPSFEKPRPLTVLPAFEPSGEPQVTSVIASELTEVLVPPPMMESNQPTEQAVELPELVVTSAGIPHGEQAAIEPVVEAPAPVETTRTSLTSDERDSGGPAPMFGSALDWVSTLRARYQVEEEAAVEAEAASAGAAASETEAQKKYPGLRLLPAAR